MVLVKYIHLFNYVTSKPSSPFTIKARIWALKKYINFLYLHEYVKDNISQHLNQPKILKKETAFLTVAVGYDNSLNTNGTIKLTYQNRYFDFAQHRYRKRAG